LYRPIRSNRKQVTIERFGTFKQSKLISVTVENTSQLDTLPSKTCAPATIEDMFNTELVFHCEMSAALTASPYGFLESTIITVRIGWERVLKKIRKVINGTNDTP
jgi:hypothetical protein